jgi:hypothetical protein
MQVLNERNEINALLEGKRLDKKHTYHSCFMMCKYFINQGITDMYEIKLELKKWADKFGANIFTNDLNYLICRVIKENEPIVEQVEVRFSEQEIEDIKFRFDRYNSRLVAFSILAFAKEHMNRDKIFTIGHVALSNWIGVSRSQINQYITELINFKFIEKVTKENLVHFRYTNKVMSSSSYYKLLIKTYNEGDIIFLDDNVRNEFEKIFNYT